jgi:hypothetical protein
MAADATGPNRHASEEAETFLKELLADGPIESNQVKRDADMAGLSWRTVRDKLEIKPHKTSMDGPWLWSLPKVAKHYEDAHVYNVDSCGPDGHLRTEPSSANGGLRS